MESLQVTSDSNTSTSTGVIAGNGAAGDYGSFPVSDYIDHRVCDEDKLDSKESYLRDCCDLAELPSNHTGTDMSNERIPVSNDLALPIFNLNCPCGPRCKTFTPGSLTPKFLQHSRFDSGIPSSDPKMGNNGEIDCAQNCFNCTENENYLSDEHYKMDFESLGGDIDIHGVAPSSSDPNPEAMLSIEEDCESSLEHPEELLNDELTLGKLDDDAIFHIASLMEARTIKHGLSQSCQRFQAMFDNDAYWKTRSNMTWGKRYPAVCPPDDFCWEDACVASEDSKRIWSDPDTNTHHFMYACNMYGEVDTVHLMENGRLLLSGDRNRNLNVIDLSKYSPDNGPPSLAEMGEMLSYSNCSIHKGWIWSITSLDNCVFTGSWDTYIRGFDMNSGVENFCSYKCKSAVLSIFAEQNEIVASCFDKNVYFFDRRSDDVTTRHFHKQAVMSVVGNQDYVISGSEDKTVVVFDRRAGKVFKTIKLDAYSLCLSYKDNQLWFGDKNGMVHLYDANDRMFNHVGTYDVGHRDKVTSIVYTPGSVFTCSCDKSLKVLTPTRNPGVITTFGAHNKALAKVDYSCGVLASAGGDESIGVWLPKHWGKDTYLL